MSTILIVYATTDGHTRLICERMSERIRAAGHGVTLQAVSDAGSFDPSTHDAVIAGASIRYGKHDPSMREFLNGNADRFGDCPVAFFSVNLVARKPEKRTVEGNQYVRKFLESLTFEPAPIEIFAGKLDYPRYKFFDRFMIRLIMKMTGGPTDPSTVVDYTDWERVDRFADTVMERLANGGTVR
ncbi:MULTISPECIES: menaquinone-dependent protoporphyrinogen IX dehydrogenase [unclassified Wenzhouxiangella]|uniref:menaquinone-dependent protoporphyrinogen IX dehydrogenase n=1 Tax=unclassified Wenzhouxiangella TaxID=2613841 RepID=UPI000E32CF6D|nr:MULTISPECIES: menaquinone-dependent protoporphyrinogen IX dehydrogenase [unclassified Wenzhouxiangella]RFF26962.1 menaquinone-dependent protoporphyrinogen IX dehydrogenase [Wenzhouxiangella sp. 15181]RFP69474.1 menaquinone-dependent protoporphyrinogen IX dehydrogenase [Wenzhouxiangella sp. 15190]